MIFRDELATYLRDYLEINQIKDYCTNGLQVEGKGVINKIVTAVTASQDAIEFAVKNHADALIVHHGYFWTNDNPIITGIQHSRISKLIKHDINLYAYHLPLDLHKTHGNNIVLANKMSLRNIGFYETLKIPDLLCVGYLETPLNVTKLAGMNNKLMLREPLILNKNSKKLINKIAICTGAAADAVYDAKAFGVDAFITGEVSERTYYQALELDMVVFASGHHATEKFGIQALGSYLAEHFQLNHQFYDSHNPI